ncbi:MAG TPA: hypothetical protein DEQ61_06540 [Streptomyces sp.]|nr:hypothetical protein [Streptomyces sp.]
MADPPRPPDAAEGAGHGTPPGVPHWVKVSGAIVGALFLLVVIAKLTGLGGDHGPGRHLGSGMPSAVVTEVQVLPGGTPGVRAPGGGIS